MMTDMDDNATATTVLSLRLTPDERRLIEEAAGKNRWKTAYFLRVTALERAAQVLNLSRPTSFDFSGAAKRFAQVLVAPRNVILCDIDVQDSTFGRFGEGPISFPNADRICLNQVRLEDFRPAALTRVQVEELKDAMRLGGPEFVAQLIDWCLSLRTVSDDPTLPAPIDPFNFKD